MNKKYAVIQCVNGSFSIVTEHGDNLDAAKMSYHSVCRNLLNSADVTMATVILVDETFYNISGYKETIIHSIENAE